MLRRIFPERIDNLYRGHPTAFWLLCVLTFANSGIALVAIFRPDGGAQSADGIPLNTYGVAAAQAVIGVVAFLGLAKLMMDLLFVLALVRYRALVPMMYLVLVVDFVAHRGIGLMKPILRDAGHPGGYVTWVLFGLSAVGLVLSVSGKRYEEI
jgi:hypothetical protein